MAFRIVATIKYEFHWQKPSTVLVKIVAVRCSEMALKISLSCGARVIPASQGA